MFYPWSVFIWPLHRTKRVQEMRNEATRTIKKDPNDTIPKVWKTGGLLRFTFTQGAQK